MKSSKKTLLFLAILAASVIADQITKNIAVKALENKGFVKVVGNFFGFELVKNPGAFLGLFSTNRWLFMIPSAAAIVLLTFWLFRQKHTHPLFCVSVSLFVGGGIGNMIDRITVGKVIDFISFRFGEWRFPNFNIADSCVTIGAVLFLFLCLFTDEPGIFGASSQKNSRTAPETASGSTEKSEAEKAASSVVRGDETEDTQMSEKND